MFQVLDLYMIERKMTYLKFEIHTNSKFFFFSYMFEVFFTSLKSEMYIYKVLKRYMFEVLHLYIFEVQSIHMFDVF